jgi:hypothetical protein
VTRDAKSIAIGVFLALVAFRLFEMVLREVEASVDPLVVVLVIAVVALGVVALGRRTTSRRR